MKVYNAFRFVSKIFRKYRYIIFLTIVVIVLLSALGALYYNEWKDSILLKDLPENIRFRRTIFLTLLSAFKSIFSSTDVTSFPGYVELKNIDWFIFLHICIGGLVLLGAFSIIKRFIFSSRWLKVKGNECFVFLGDVSKVNVLANSIFAKHPKSKIIYFTDEQNATALSLNPRIFIVYFEDIRDSDDYESYMKYFWEKVRSLHFLYMYEDSSKNILEAVRLARLFKSFKSARNYPKPRVFMFANSDEYFDAHNTNLESLVEFNFINYSKLVALNFVSKHPPISFMKISDHSKAEVESPFKILFLGFGLLGESMFKAMFELGRFPNVASGGDFKAYAFDMRASHLKNKFLRRYPAFKNIEYARDYIEFIEGDIYSGDFEDKIVPLFKNVNCVIVSLGNDSLNRRVAYECDLICKRLGMPQKFFVAQLESLSEFYFESDDTIEFFGALQGILTEASVLKTDIEKLMSGINEVYGKINGYSKQKWENLNEMQRDTNLYLSLAIRTKLALLGLNFERFEKFNSLLLSPEVIDSLAHFEHLRWEAHYFVNGWDRLHFDSKSYIDRNMKFKPGMEKDSVRKLHMCLVTWRELDELNKCSPHYKDHKAFDIAVSRLLSELACKINKDPF